MKMLTPYRTLMVADTEYAQKVLLELIHCFSCVQATDGVWLPKCDLAQYERGECKALDTVQVVD